MATNETKSVGHYGYVEDADGYARELFRAHSGDWYWGIVTNAIDVRTGYRMGRWLGPARWTARDALAYLGLRMDDVFATVQELRDYRAGVNALQDALGWHGQG